MFVGDIVVTWPHLELGWAGPTLDTKQNRDSAGKISELPDLEFLGVGGPPVAADASSALRKLVA